MLYYDIIESPIGKLLLLTGKLGLKKILFEDQIDNIEENWQENRQALEEVRQQLESYFAGELKNFSVKLDPDGTAFQKQVWNQLQQIPHGETTTYQDIANQLNKPKASRAIGMANALNPIPIIVPCHRVIGKNGKLTGYAGGLQNKSILLQLEGIQLGNTDRQYSLF